MSRPFRPSCSSADIRRSAVEQNAVNFDVHAAFATIESSRCRRRPARESGWSKLTTFRSASVTSACNSRSPQRARRERSDGDWLGRGRGSRHAPYRLESYTCHSVTGMSAGHWLEAFFAVRPSERARAESGTRVTCAPRALNRAGDNVIGPSTLRSDFACLRTSASPVRLDANPCNEPITPGGCLPPRRLPTHPADRGDCEFLGVHRLT
jgi:hypothetical protein